MKRANYKFLAILILTLAVSIVVYPQLPATVASHFNAAGEVNGTMNRFWGAFLVPLIMVMLYVVYAVIPHIDPLGENIASFRRAYDVFWLGVLVFLLYLHMLTLAFNTGWRFNMTVALVPGLAALFWLIGWLMSQSRRNWFIGIRTPWTLSSDSIWEATHRMAGTLFKVAGILMLGALVFPSLSLWFIFVPILIAALVPIVHSYLLYRRHLTSR
ncbi:MAG TPA: SdpI family protein [Candidatus Paceibacterota bacterium]|nr:SdpI family protein [Candidatus Paceibacterota bacterium]